jgi:hypothetical protein
LNIPTTGRLDEDGIVVVVLRVAVGPVLEQELDSIEMTVGRRVHQGGPELAAIRLIDRGSSLEPEANYFSMAEGCCTV